MVTRFDSIQRWESGELVDWFISTLFFVKEEYNGEHFVHNIV